MSSKVTRISGMYSGMDTENIISQLTQKYVAKKDKVWKKRESLKYKQDVWKDMNKDVYGFYTKLSSLRLQSTYRTEETTSSDKNVAEVSGKTNGQQTLTINQIATQTFMTGGKVEQKEPIGINGTISIKVGGQDRDLNITPDMSMEQVAKKLSEAGIIANFDEQNARLFLTSKSTGAASNFEITGDTQVMEALGLGSTATKQIGQNAKINLNGVDFESDTNNFKVNGLNIAAVAPGTTIVGTKSSDTIYENVKSLFDTYNELIKKVDTAYNTNNSSYNPLSEDEKEALTEKQIEEWEKKIKEGALYRDSNLGDISNVLKNTMASKIEDSFLSSFGIKTGDYFTTDKNERGIYNIDETALKNAIAEDPDKVINFMTKLAAKVYDELGKEMKSTSMRSVYTVYDDKQMKADIASYEEELKAWEDKITAYEDKWYNKFSKMETALSKLQSKNDYLMSYFV